MNRSICGRILEGALVATISIALLGSRVFAASPADEPPTRASADSPAPAAPSTQPPAEPVPEHTEEPEIFERLLVVGSADRASGAPGSVTYLDEETLARQANSDVHRALRQVPGVNLQEEEGYGLRPNIGMRGSGSDRSARITLMEDGVLIAPAPYSAPAAYYFPTVGRMEGIEVRKGSASIRQGPYTVGGALNLVSTGIPSELGGMFDVAGGDDSTMRGRFHVGDAGNRIGWLFETFQMATDGFKDLDSGGETGFVLEDYLGKVRFTSKPLSRRFQAIELKLGKTGQDGDETYLGLAREDFDSTPYRRYAGSQEDTLVTDHRQVQASYFLRASDTLDLTAVAYRNDFSRNWRKVESVQGVSIATVLDDPTLYAAELAILRADLETDSPVDALTVRDNRRSYYGEGLQTVVGVRPRSDSTTRHEIEIGLRIHADEEDRFQEDDRFQMTTAGDMVETAAGAPGSQANRLSQASAIALFVQDTIERGRFTFTPGLRYESIDLRLVEYADPDRTTVRSRRASDVNQAIPGVGVTYAIDPISSVFLGIHRGFAPPSPSTTVAEPEESLSYELGYRRRGNVRFEAIGFFNDYDQLLGTCTVSSGCSTADVGDQFNSGAARTRGLETVFGIELARRGVTRVPIDFTYTYTGSEFLTPFQSDFGPWAAVEAGDEFPYLPRHQGALSIGAVHPRVSVFATGVYVAAMRAVAGQGPLDPDESTDATALLDLTVRCPLRPSLTVYAQMRNLTDEAYVAALRPAGLRPGLDRSLLVGATFGF